MSDRPVNTQVALRLSRVLLYAAFLAPLTLSVAGDGVSANYLFGILVVLSPRFRKNTDAAAYVVYITISLLIGIAIFSQFDSYFILRQIVSYSLALLAALLLFLRLDVDLEEFLTAVVLCAVAYSLYVGAMFVHSGLSLINIFVIKSSLRDYVTDWPQRYAVVLVFAFFVALRRYTSGIAWQIAGAIILACIFLTFTRTAWAGVVLGLLVYVAASRRAARSRRTVRARRGPRFLAWFAVLMFGGGLAFLWSDHAVDGAMTAMMTNFSDVQLSDLSDVSPNGSEGERLETWSKLTDAIARDPFSGTGFAGAYLVAQDEGSAHSEYMDVLLRSGIVGLAFYGLFWYRLMSYYGRRDPGVLAGLVALLIYGVSQETTKLSYGAVIFFVLLSKAYDRQPESSVESRALAHPLRS